MNRLISLLSTDVCVKWGGGGVKYKLVVARGSTGPHRCECRFRYGHTVLHLTLRYVHELGIRRLLFVHTSLLQKSDTQM